MAIKIISKKTRYNSGFDVSNEMAIHNEMRHISIAKLLEYGVDGEMLQDDGTVQCGIQYLILEYVPGGELFHLCQYVGQLGDNRCKVFFK